MARKGSLIEVRALITFLDKLSKLYYVWGMENWTLPCRTGPKREREQEASGADGPQFASIFMSPWNLPTPSPCIRRANPCHACGTRPFHTRHAQTGHPCRCRYSPKNSIQIWITRWQCRIYLVLRIIFACVQLMSYRIGYNGAFRGSNTGTLNCVPYKDSLGFEGFVFPWHSFLRRIITRKQRLEISWYAVICLIDLPFLYLEYWQILIAVLVGINTTLLTFCNIVLCYLMIWWTRLICDRILLDAGRNTDENEKAKVE